MWQQQRFINYRANPAATMYVPNIKYNSYLSKLSREALIKFLSRAAALFYSMFISLRKLRAGEEIVALATATRSAREKF